MKKWKLLLLIVCLAVSSACTSTPEQAPSPPESTVLSPPPVESPQPEHDSESASPEESSQPQDGEAATSPPSPESTGETTPTGEPSQQASPEESSQPQDGTEGTSPAKPNPEGTTENTGEAALPAEPSQQAPSPAKTPAPEAEQPPVPDTNPPEAPVPRQLSQEELNNLISLEYFLFETLPRESFAYMETDLQTGVLTVGYVQQDVILAAIEEYTGDLCPVIYQAAEYSMADSLALLERIHQEIPLPSGSYIMDERKTLVGRRPEMELVIYTDGEERADAIQQEILAIASELEYPAEALIFTRMTQGENPDT